MGLTKEMLQERMKKGTVVVNVLEVKAYDDLHIPGSINIPLMGKSDDDFANEVRKKVGTEKEIVTHCSGFSCSAGPRAAAILKARGFKAMDYPGGIEDWADADLPLEGKKVVKKAS